jgi:hypothetical protein
VPTPPKLMPGEQLLRRSFVGVNDVVSFNIKSPQAKIVWLQ